MKRLARTPYRLDHPDGEGDGLAWKLVEFTPNLAAYLLMAAPEGDTRSDEYKSHVRGLGADMEADAFPATGDTVVLATDGILNDGRARLRAAVRTQTSFWAYLVTGADPEARFCTDLREAGTRRAAARRPVATASGGLDEARALVLRACALARQLDVRRMPGGQSGAEPGDLDRSFALAKGVPERGGLNRASLAAFHFLAGGRDACRAEGFVATLRDRTASAGGPPAEIAASVSSGALAAGSEAMLAEMAQAWICLRNGLPYAPGATAADAAACEDVLARFALPRSRGELPGPAGLDSAVRSGRPRMGLETIGVAEARGLIDTVGVDGMADYAEISADLAAGRWRQTGQAIKVDADGRLLDGRRRLAAVLETGIPIRVLVARGLDPAVAAFLHRGRKESLGHRLQAEGSVHKQPYDIASACRNLLRHRSGDPTLQPSVPAMREAMLAHPEVVEGVRLAKGLKRAYRMRVGIVASCYAIMAAEDEGAARLFLHRLERPPMTDGGSAVLELRKRLQEDRPPDSAAGQAEMTRLVLDAWRRERLGAGGAGEALAVAE